MPPTSYRNVAFITVIASKTTPTLPVIPQYTRCKLNPTEGANFVVPAGATERGDYITEGDAVPGYPIAAVEIDRGGDFIGIAAVDIAVTDSLYSAANGQVTNSNAGGAVYLGKPREAVTAGLPVGILIKNAP